MPKPGLPGRAVRRPQPPSSSDVLGSLCLPPGGAHGPWRRDWGAGNPASKQEKQGQLYVQHYVSGRPSGRRLDPSQLLCKPWGWSAHPLFSGDSPWGQGGRCKGFSLLGPRHGLVSATGPRTYRLPRRCKLILRNSAYRERPHSASFPGSKALDGGITSKRSVDQDGRCRYFWNVVEAILWPLKVN